jgi:hypothetical protein
MIGAFILKQKYLFLNILLLFIQFVIVTLEFVFNPIASRKIEILSKKEYVFSIIS